jgi:hypothetical protein
MTRRERPQAPLGLRQLALAADAVATPGLVPRDRDVHEALEEVPLGRLRRAPCVLERLVRGEELTSPHQLDPAPEVCVDSAHDATLGCYSPTVATILLAGVDLYFRGKLEALLPGHHLVTVDSIDEPELVIVDIARVDPEEVADTYPDIPILGFTNHTDTAGLRAAQAAGFDQVVVKSALDERAVELVDGLIASVDSDAS